MRTHLDAPAGGGAQTRRTVTFAARLVEHGERVALVTPGGESVTYAQLAVRVHDEARSWGPARRLVLVEGANDLATITTYLAALAAGHPVILVPGDDPARTSELIAAYDPDITRCASLGQDSAQVRRDESVHELHPSLALMMSTSGSTGSAKLVRLSHQNLESNAAAVGRYLGLGDSDRAITSLPLHYCYGLSVLHSHLVAGAGIVLTDTSVVDPCFWDRFHAHGVTGLAGVPHTFDLLDRVGFGSMELPSLRWVTQAGGRLAPEKVQRQLELAERGGWRFFVMYGQTEATARMAYLPPELAASHPGSIGRPIDGGSFRIDPIPGEAHGELVYRGPNVMLGYATSPADLAAGRTVEELRTGDLARIGHDGLVEIVGRASRFIKPFGLRVDLDAVEGLLRGDGVDATCTGDDEALVVAVPAAPDTADGTAPAGPDDAAPAAPDDTAIRSMLRERLGLPPARIRVVRCAELPRLANGKPDYVGIRALAAEPADAADTTDALDGPGPGSRCAAAPPQEPAAPDTHPVRRIFAEVLGVQGIAEGDSFVSLGGDSLSYVEASMRLERTLGRVPDGWHLMPVGELDAMRPVDTSRRRRFRRVETNVALRALAIVLVVCTHSELFKQQGGAHLLFALAGYNFARFQLGVTGPLGTRRRAGSIARIAVPTLALTGVAMATREGFSPANVALVHNYVGDGRWWYWYVEALLQVLVVATVAFSIPAVQRLERARPFALPLALLVPLLATRFGVVGTDHLEIPLVAAHVIAWLFVLGWLAQRARTIPQRLVVSAVTLLTVPGLFDDTNRNAVVTGGLLLALWVTQVRIPAPLHRVVGVLAGASLYIYLTHFFVFAEVRDAEGPLAAVAASLALGVLAWLAVEHGRRMLVDPARAWITRRRDTGLAWRAPGATPSM